MRNGLNSTGSNLWDLRNDKKKKERKNRIVNKNELEEPRFQINKFKFEKDLSDSRRMGVKDLLFLL